jgi:hypothetical protein
LRVRRFAIFAHQAVNPPVFKASHNPADQRRAHLRQTARMAAHVARL